MSDMHVWLHLLARYGYLVVFAGTFLEGETVLTIAGMLAREGYFSLPLVVLCAFAGSLGSDQLMFFIGRRYGPAVLQKRPGLRRASARIGEMVRRRESLFILGFRFVCGIRNAAPVILGAQGVNPRKFFLLNVLGAAAWAALFSVAGYAFGGLAERFVGKLHAVHHLWLALFMLLALAAAAAAFFRIWRKK